MFHSKYKIKPFFTEVKLFAFFVKNGLTGKSDLLDPLVQMNPYTLGAYFIKDNGTSAFYWPLITGLENNKSWCKELEIGMTVRRRAVGGAPTEVMKVKTQK